MLISSNVHEFLFYPSEKRKTSADLDSDSAPSTPVLQHEYVIAAPLSPTNDDIDRVLVKQENDYVVPELDPLASIDSMNLKPHPSAMECSTADDRNNPLMELRQKVLAEQLNVFKKQMEVLNVQKMVYSLKKELLLSKLKETL